MTGGEYGVELFKPYGSTRPTSITLDADNSEMCVRLWLNAAEARELAAKLNAAADELARDGVAAAEQDRAVENQSQQDAVNKAEMRMMRGIHGQKPQPDA